MTAIVLRVGRLTWYRQRWAVTAILVLFGAITAALIAQGIAARVALDANGVGQCLTTTCDAATRDRFYSIYDGATSSAALTAHLLLAVPPAAALFAGLPWLTREFETGSFRYTWVQGIRPVRWLLGTFGSLTVIAAVAAVACGAVFDWWYRVAQGAVNVTPASGWDWDAFGLSPIAQAGWTVFAMSLAMLIASAIRRTVPAMAAFAVIYGGCLFAGEQYLRPWVLSLAPVVAHGNFYSITFAPDWPARYWVNGWLTGPDGHVLTQAQTNSVLNAAYLAKSSASAVGQWLAAHHYTYWGAYQPASGLLAHQLAYAFILLAVSALSVLTAVRLIRHQLPI